MRITFLGTGTSHGVPSIDCMINDYRDCPAGVCRKALADARYRRLRSSLLIESNGSRLLFDTSQDFREQMLEQRVPRIDAVFYTHGHADHIFGLPDIRSYCHRQQDAVDVYGSQESLEIIRSTFGYIFEPPVLFPGGIPRLRTHLWDKAGDWRGERITPVPVVHAALRGCQGYRVGRVAYVPDAHAIPSESLDLLRGLDLLILNCLRLRPHATHLSLAESVAYAQELRPARCLLTHMTHDIDYAIEEPRLPAWVRFASDGLVVEA